MNYTATYSPDDNKLRLYAGGRLPPDVYERVRAAGFIWAPKQELFVAPAWTPGREDLLLELAGEIDDEDTSLCERAEERAERFEDYSEKRGADAEAARQAVAAIADNIPLGQPILIGHHSERHARRDAEKIENGMRRAVKMWETSTYWTRRAAGAIDNAKYKERPDVRARRIKGIEADARKIERTDKTSAAELLFFDLIDKPEKWKPLPDGRAMTREERAAYVAGRVNAYTSRKTAQGNYWSVYDVLRLPIEERYKDAPVMTVDEVLADVRASYARATAYRQRWAAHYAHRLEYERAMLGEAGGTIADRTKPEVGGGCRCWASPRGGWSYIKKVNKVSVTVLDNWGNGGRDFTRVIPFDKLAAVMTAAQVQEARESGRLVEIGVTGYALCDTPPEGKGRNLADLLPPKGREEFEAMRKSLAAGVQVVSAPQLFPTPPDVAARMVELAEIEPGHRVLEPSAGSGQLLGAICHDGPEVEAVAVEINADCARMLQLQQNAGAYRGAIIRQQDFLECNGNLGEPFDRVIMNPPFENGADIKHIRHALGFLKPGGLLVAICANGPRQIEQLQPLADSWEELPSGTFAGTGVRAAILTIRK